MRRVAWWRSFHMEVVQLAPDETGAADRLVSCTRAYTHRLTRGKIVERHYGVLPSRRMNQPKSPQHNARKPKENHHQPLR